MRPLLLALGLAAACTASAQTSTPPFDLPALPGPLQGTWVMTDAPAYESGPTIHQMTLHVEGNRVTQRDSLSLGERAAVRSFTATCAEAEGLVSCWPSDEGTQTGYGHLGRYRVDGDTLSFEDPVRGTRVVFTRMRG